MPILIEIEPRYPKAKHGEYIKEGRWKDSRWCEAHQQCHGHLYLCETYPPEVSLEVSKHLDLFRSNGYGVVHGNDIIITRAK